MLRGHAAPDHGAHAAPRARGDAAPPGCQVGAELWLRAGPQSRGPCARPLACPRPSRKPGPLLTASAPQAAPRSKAEPVSCAGRRGAVSGVLSWPVAVRSLALGGLTPAQLTSHARPPRLPRLLVPPSPPWTAIPPGGSPTGSPRPARVGPQRPPWPAALVSGCGCSSVRPQGPKPVSPVRALVAQPGPTRRQPPVWAAGSPGGHHSGTRADHGHRAVLAGHLAGLRPWL